MDIATLKQLAKIEDKIWSLSGQMEEFRDIPTLFEVEQALNKAISKMSDFREEIETERLFGSK
tara:strand:- start:121 stop:309 length:189 start_codon:yes stop_codon:yes gene_type:complete